MKERHYIIEDAKRFGILEAIVLYNIRFWIEKNAANKKHFYDGKYWTYNTALAMSELFEEISTHQMRRILSSLKDQGAIIVGNYNKLKYDRSQWYALGPELENMAISENANSNLQNSEIHFAKSLNGNGENAKPIPDIKPDIITDNNNNKSETQKLKSWDQIKDEQGIMEFKDLIQEAINDTMFVERMCMQLGQEKKISVEIMKCYIYAIYSHWKHDIKVTHNNRSDLRRHLMNTIKKDIYGDNFFYKQALLIQKQKQNK